MSEITAAEVSLQLEGHERVCEERSGHIEHWMSVMDKKLDQVDEKLNKLILSALFGSVGLIFVIFTSKLL